ncbi:MAG TPA: hypothetical protein VET24_05765 [Actinomycetota bacterium]|nr:hypothetical protein [Actinomycetota bacterium]
MRVAAAGPPTGPMAAAGLVAQLTGAHPRAPTPVVPTTVLLDHCGWRWLRTKDKLGAGRT